jgi:hypothetical protein
VFSRLARRHPTTHFLRLPSQYAEDMPSTALPAVLAYRRGQLIANLVHIVDELVPGASVNVNTIETILSKYSPPSKNNLILSGREYYLLPSRRVTSLFDIPTTSLLFVVFIGIFHSLRARHHHYSGLLEHFGNVRKHRINIPQSITYPSMPNPSRSPVPK